ncbi:hypothetical protein D3C76_1264320 [compost metagenome]
MQAVADKRREQRGQADVPSYFQLTLSEEFFDVGKALCNSEKNRLLEFNCHIWCRMHSQLWEVGSWRTYPITFLILKNELKRACNSNRIGTGEQRR